MKKYIFAAFFAFCGICFAQSIEDELRLLGWDDFILDDSRVQAAADTTQSEEADETDENGEDSTEQDGEDGETDSSAAIQTAETAQTGETASVSSETRGGGSGGMRQPMSAAFSAASVPSGPRGGGGPTGPVISVFDTAGVAGERSIDFSRNLSEYRSPQRALFLSLLVPGLGQIYNKNYWKSGLYAAIEIGMITGAVYFNRDAKRIRRDAEKFAKDNFDENQLRAFYENLTAKTMDMYLNDTVVNDLIFGVFRNTAETSAIDQFFAELNNDFYGRSYGVGSRRFSAQGWSDMDANYFFSTDFNKIFVPDDSITQENIFARGSSVFGVSGKQNFFLSQMDESRRAGRRSSVFVVGIFVNHIASATDAFISTIIHNRRLLREESGEKITKAEEILSRISIESDMYFDNNSDLTSKLGLVWRF